MSFQVMEKIAPVASQIALCSADPQVERNLRRLGARSDHFSNNYRNKDIPLLIDCRKWIPSAFELTELFAQARRIAETGGCVVLFQPATKLFHKTVLPRLIEPVAMHRINAYVLDSPLFAGLPVDGPADFVYADVHPDEVDSAADIQASGGKVWYGSLGTLMWTRPSEYLWGAGLYEVPVGHGKVIVSHLKLLGGLEKSPVAQRILQNLIGYAKASIRPGGAERLLSRCIDPVR